MKKILTLAMGIVFTTALSVPTLSFADSSLIGKHCFSMDGFADTWEWQINMIAPDVYTFTGIDSAAHCAMTGGGQVDPDSGLLLLTIQSACRVQSVDDFPMYGKYHLALDLELLSGTANVTWNLPADEYSSLEYSRKNRPFRKVDCPCLCEKSCPEENGTIAKPSITNSTNSKLRNLKTTGNTKEYKIHSSMSY